MEITKKNLTEILTNYFGLNDSDGSYTYTLTRDKSGFEVDTVKLDDFEEFDSDQIEDLANYILDNIGAIDLNEIEIDKTGVWYYGEEYIIHDINYEKRTVALISNEKNNVTEVNFELLNEIVEGGGYFKLM